MRRSSTAMATRFVLRADHVRVGGSVRSSRCSVHKPRCRICSQHNQNEEGAPHAVGEGPRVEGVVQPVLLVEALAEARRDALLWAAHVQELFEAHRDAQRSQAGRVARRAPTRLSQACQLREPIVGRVRQVLRHTRCTESAVRRGEVHGVVVVGARCVALGRSCAMPVSRSSACSRSAAGCSMNSTASKARSTCMHPTNTTRKGPGHGWAQGARRRVRSHRRTLCVALGIALGAHYRR